MFARILSALVVLLITVPSVFAQSESEPEDCEGGSFNVSSGFLSAQLGGSADDSSVTTSPDAAALTEAEERVQAIIRKDGVHVVHFWAPWCSNSINELRGGWYELVENHPDVTFTFVTIWNHDGSGRHEMNRYALPERVVELTQPDYGPSDNKSQRRRAFLGLPVTWIPTTMIFHQNGELAFSMNYGEMDMETIDHLLAVTQREW